MASGMPSAKFRVPLTGHFLSHPPMLTVHYWAKNYPAVEKLGGFRKIIRRRNNYLDRARVDQKFEKKNRKDLKLPKIVAQCRKYPIPLLDIFLYITVP